MDMWKKKLSGGVAAGIILSACLGFLPQPAMAAPVIANMPHRANGTKITTPQQTPKGMPQDVISRTRKPMPEAPLKTEAPAAVPVSPAEGSKASGAGEKAVSPSKPETVSPPPANKSLEKGPTAVSPPTSATAVETKSGAAAQNVAQKPAAKVLPKPIVPPQLPAATANTAVEKAPSAQVKIPAVASSAAPAPLAKPAAPAPVVPPKKTEVLPQTQPKPTKPLAWEKPKERPPVAPSVKPKKNGGETPAVKSVYQVGDKGWKVKQAQQYLQSLGFAPQDTDGQFTKATRKALRNFQKKYHLKVTGNLDNATYTELKWQVESKEYGGNVESLKILKTAAKYRGVHYVWGGTTPNGFDCSGYVQYVFAQHGIKLSRTADTQALEGKHVAKKDLKPGDLVFFSTYEPGASHDGIYAGNGKFWNATSSRGIMLSDLNDSYWGPRYYTARRILRSNDRRR